MSFDNQYRNSKILFGISLFLLIGFVTIWLKTVYQDKTDELENQVNFLWIKAIKDVEGKDFANLIVTTISSEVDSFEKRKNSIPNTVFEEYSDSSHQIKIAAKYSISDTDRHEEVEITINDDSFPSSFKRPSHLMFLDSSIEKSTKIFKSSLSGFASDLGDDITTIMQKFALDVELVQSKLDSTLKLNNLPISYTIKTFDLDTEQDEQDNLKDKFYTKTATGSSYSLTLKNYRFYVLQSMWLEFLLALFLLSTIAAAFYYILNSLKKQHQLVHIKNDLISNITHELRTPIFTVSAALEALESFNGLDNPERTKEYLDISKNELNRLSILVEKVLKTSLFEQSALKIHKEKFSLNQLVKGLNNAFKLQLEKEQATLNIEVTHNDITVFADKIHLTNVFYNLIDNALKYRAETAPVLTIRLSEDSTSTFISIQDNGIGIPEEYQNKIFTKFFRVPKGNVHNVKGYGLGLNYVGNIIRQHGGEIKVHSNIEKGSSFLIQLPK